METSVSAPQYTQQEQHLFQQVDDYPWASDNEFQMGLRSILGGNAPSPQTADIELRARCFFFARKAGQQVDFQHYKAWHHAKAAEAATAAINIQSSTQEERTGVLSTATNGNAPLAEILARASRNGSAAINSGPDDGGAKFSYAEIVEMIQSGKEIPGIKQIPSTILQGQGSSSSQTRRKKPWERDETEELGSEVVTT